MTFVLSDYNDAVLRLVTLPNIILTWAEIQKEHEAPNADADGSSKGDLELSDWVLKQFTSELQVKDIKLVFLSGPWTPALADLIPSSSPTLGSVILGAETIYSPASTAAFVDLVITILQRVKMAKAMIGAKRLYFGVGGSVDGL